MAHGKVRTRGQSAAMHRDDLMGTLKALTLETTSSSPASSQLPTPPSTALEMH